MDMAWYGRADVVLVVEDHPFTPNKFIIDVSKDRHGGMESVLPTILDDSMLIPLMKAAKYAGKIEQESSSKANFYYVLDRTLINREFNMIVDDYFVWVVQQFGPPDLVTWATARRIVPARPADIRKERLKEGRCPECGADGEMRLRALVCRVHGFYAGI